MLDGGQTPPNPANPQNKQKSPVVNFPALIPQNEAAWGYRERLLLGLRSGGETRTMPRGGGPLSRLRPPSCPQVLGHLKRPQHNRVHQHPFRSQSPLLPDPVGGQGEHRGSEAEAKAPRARLGTEPALEAKSAHLRLSPSWRRPLMWQKANTPPFEPSQSSRPTGVTFGVAVRREGPVRWTRAVPEQCGSSPVYRATVF